MLVLAMIGVSVVFLFATAGGVVSGGDARAITFFLARLALCLLFGWYLLSRGVREAFQHKRAAATSSSRD
jgi:hypothetical protein